MPVRRDRPAGNHPLRDIDNLVSQAPVHDSSPPWRCGGEVISLLIPLPQAASILMGSR
jgi:hypothetical protein